MKTPKFYEIIIFNNIIFNLLIHIYLMINFKNKDFRDKLNHFYIKMYLDTI